MAKKEKSESTRILAKLKKKGRARFALSGGPNAGPVGKEIFQAMLKWWEKEEEQAGRGERPLVMICFMNGEARIIERLDQVTPQGEYIITRREAKKVI